MTNYEGKAPKPRRGVGSAAATRKWRLKKDIEDMRAKRIEREKKGAQDLIARRRAAAERAVPALTGKEWSRMVAINAADQVVKVSRVADKVPDMMLNMSFDYSDLSAYTDFYNVNLQMDEFSMPQRTDSKEVLAEKIAVIKGIAYHEIGHIRFTVRPWQLFPNTGDYYLFPVWNILEDQRMESHAASLNARQGNLFTIMVANVILDGHGKRVTKEEVNHWILLAGREYLPMEVLEAAYFSSPWDEETREQWFNIVHRYKKADNILKMRYIIKEAYDFLMKEMPQAATGGADGAAGGAGGSIDDHRLGQTEADAEGDGGPSADLGQTHDGDEDGKAKSPMAGKDAPLGVTDQSLLDAVINAKREAVEKFAKAGDVNKAVSRVNEQASAQLLPPPDDRLSSPMNPEVEQQSKLIAEGMKKALSSFVTETEPYWENRQEVGVLDALAYRTREVGSRDYRRRRIDQNGKGRNVHVSLLCDVSGSMHGEPMLALSMSLYATALACDELNIGRTFILWSTAYYQIWANNTRPEAVVWNSMGGTEPIPALDTLNDHNPEEADNHLVLVFTDGAWYDQAPLTQWGAPGRKIIVLHYGRYRNNQNLGADEEIHIDNVLDIPMLLTNAIGDLVMGDG